MEKFTIAERYTNENETPIQVGDKIKVFPTEEWKLQGLKLKDEYLEEYGGAFLKVEDIKHDNGIFFYTCSTVDSEIVPILFVDSDIKYVLR